MKTYNKYIIALLAIFAFAPVVFAQTGSGSASSDDSKIVLQKKVSANKDGSGYTLTLETWATGEEVAKQTTTVKATDIILLLDVSGSMYNRMSGTGSPRKIAAMKESANKFLDAVKQSASDNNVTHKVAIVQFAEAAASDGRTYKGTRMVQALTNISGTTNLSTMKSTINNFDTDGDTAADWAMQLACNILEGSKNDGNNKVVVMLTDGVPNHGGDPIDGKVANAAIYFSHIAKNVYNASVFTIGVFETEPTGDCLKYLNYVSSNYPDANATVINGGSGLSTISAATSTSNQGTYGTYNGHDISYYFNGTQSSTNCNLTTNSGTKKSSDYYTTVSTDVAMDEVFQKIASTAVTGGASTTLSAEAVVMDYIAPDFTLPDGANKDMIKVYQARVNPETSSASGIVWQDSVAVNLTVNVTKNSTTQLVTVTGFDYTKGDTKNGNEFIAFGNWVGPRQLIVAGQAEAVPYYEGCKLIIEIPIEVDPDSPGGANRPTNTDASGIYVDGEPIAPYPKPEVDLPVPVTIQKVGMDVGDNAVFTITWKAKIPTGYAEHFPGTYMTSVVLTGKGQGEENMVSATIYLEPAIYTITEDTAWSQGYTRTDSTAADQLIDRPRTLKYVNTKVNPGPEDVILNKFTTVTRKVTKTVPASK